MLSQPTSARKQLPNKLRINFEDAPPSKDTGNMRTERNLIVASEMQIMDQSNTDNMTPMAIGDQQEGGTYMRDLIRASKHHAFDKQRNMRILSDNAEQRQGANRSEVFPPQRKLESKRPRKFQVRKLLKLNGGLFTPTNT